jgi:hypothetical protein
MSQFADSTYTDPIPEDVMFRLKNCLSKLRLTPSRVVDGNELHWVKSRVDEIRNASHLHQIISIQLTASASLIEQLSLQAALISNFVGDQSWLSWDDAGTEYHLESTDLYEGDLSKGVRFEIAALLNNNLWFGPIPGIAYAGGVNTVVHQTRWVLEIIDGSDPETAYTASRLIG